MPGVALSSNWKKLQATLSKEKPKDKPKDGAAPSRKASLSKGPKPTGDSLKRKRPTPASTNPFKRTRMETTTAAPAPVPLLPPIEALPSITTPLTPAQQNAGLIAGVKAGRYLALDCEMVATTMDTSRLARVSIVNYHLQPVYDSFVLPEVKDPVVDYRTAVSGVRPQDLRKGYARPIKDVQKDVAKLLNGRVLVGHALRNDLEALDMKHSGAATRDTAKCTAYRALAGGRSPALRELSKKILGVSIQGAEHCSVVDARASMELYKREKRAMDDDIRKKYGAMIGRQGEGVLNGVVKKDEESDEEDEGDEEEEQQEDQGNGLLDGETDGEKHVTQDDGDADAPAKKKKKKKKKRNHKSRSTRA